MIRYLGAGLALVLAGGTALGAAAQAEPFGPGLSFLKFTVADSPKMEAFYEKAFGMTVQKRLDNGGNTEVILSSPGGADLALVHYKDNRPITLGNANGPIGFYLKDVDGAYQRAMAAGATSRYAPRGGKGVRVALVADPEGHDIELLRLD